MQKNGKMKGTFEMALYIHNFVNKFPKRNDMTVNKKQKNR